MHKAKAFFTKLFYWEHWPSYMFYLPLIPYYLLKALKAGNPVFYLATNPSIKYSGNGTESKYATLQLIPEKHCPKSILVEQGRSFNEVLTALNEYNIKFPVIAKPDIGFRGYLVKLIKDSATLKQYLNDVEVTTIVQEFISYPNECGIFYYRYPDKEKGHITSITLKKFAAITGNGTDTLAELILADQRAYLYFDLFKNIHKNALDKVPKKGQKVKLSLIGNHSKGTTFINGCHLIDSELENTFDKIAKSIKGFYYGRFDLKYESWNKLKKGENFTILELNGIIAEPTHIYDPKRITYFQSIKTIKDHWKYMNDIALINHKKNKIPYPEIAPYLKDILWLRKYAKQIVKLNKKF